MTGGAGTGKSHLIKAIYQTDIKISKRDGNIECPSAILIAPAGVTGVATVNIGGSTINTAVPKNTYGAYREHLTPLSDQRKIALRLNYLT